jgi:hypothetical protein
MHTKTWNVDVFLSEEDATTSARAVLHANGARELVAHGSARRNPHDPEIAEIGDEIAAARALSSLAHLLLDSAADDLSAVTTEHVQLLS